MISLRFIIVASLSAEAGNKMMKEPNAIQTLENYINSVNAEAAYFSEANGERTFYIVVDLPSVDMIPAFGEPLFNLGARVELHPAMDIADLKKDTQKLTPAS